MLEYLRQTRITNRMTCLIAYAYTYSQCEFFPCKSSHFIQFLNERMTWRVPLAQPDACRAFLLFNRYGYATRAALIAEVATFPRRLLGDARCVAIAEWHRRKPSVALFRMSRWITLLARKSSTRNGSDRISSGNNNALPGTMRAPFVVSISYTVRQANTTLSTCFISIVSFFRS